MNVGIFLCACERKLIKYDYSSSIILAFRKFCGAICYMPYTELKEITKWLFLYFQAFSNIRIVFLYIDNDI